MEEVETEETGVIVRCFRCKEIRDLNYDLMECPDCGAMTCGILPCNGRCMCYELRLSVWPESRAYYDLLDTMNAKNDTSTQEEAAFKAELDSWEEAFAERGL